MNTFFLIAAGLFGLLTLASLIFGIVGMAEGGPMNARYGNLFMRGRVLFQGLTLLALFGAFAL